jgi:hypothetical protein
MPGRVSLSHHASMRMSEKQHLLQSKVATELLHVGDVVVDLVRASIGRPV